MDKIDGHRLRIKMMASYLHYLVTNRCTKAFSFDEIQNLNFPPKTSKSISRLLLNQLSATKTTVANMSLTTDSKEAP